MSGSDEDAGLVEETKKALTEDVEVPIDKKTPGATFSLVAFSYMAILAFAAIVLATGLWAFGVWSEPEADQSLQKPPGVATSQP